jgi:Do/DeqQ family serine protease
MNKMVKQFLIGLVGGIFAIVLFKLLEANDGPFEAGKRETNSLGQPISYNTSTVDSIQNVFSVGFGEAAASTLRQVVHIRSRITTQAPRNRFFEFFGDEFWQQQYKNQQWQESQVQEAAGSGVILTADGYIVTNNHVVDNASGILVSLSNGKSYDAKIIGTDPSTDLAVLKIDERELPAAKVANSDEVRVGDWVLAVGNPFNLASTVTAGIVSAKARNIHILSDNSAIESFIQTDAAVNPGNSGGALVNLSGELIGINTAIATPTGTFAGYSFAVPGNIVKKVTNDLIEYGEVKRGYIGVVILDLTWQLAQEMGLDLSQGVVVANVARNGAAHKAGLKTKDIIQKVNGAPIQTTPQLLEIIAAHKPGDVLNVEIQRRGKQITIPVRLQDAKSLSAASIP